MNISRTKREESPGGVAGRHIPSILVATGILAAAAALSIAAPPLMQAKYRNPVWPDSNVVSQVWWAEYASNAGFAAVGGFASLTGTNPGTAGPATGNLIIAESSFAEPCSGIGANFQLGDMLTPPLGVNSNVAPVLDFMGGTTNAVWLDYAGQLIASDMGAVQVSWTLTNSTTQTLVYTVSPSPTRRPVRLYWTEGQNAGPTISFASTYRVDIFYNSQIRTTNDVWIDSNQLHASPSCGTGGRFLLTYSRVDEGSGKRELLAYEIVEVLQPMSSVRYAYVGDRLLPQERPYSTDNLFASVTRGIIDPAGQETPYVYQHFEGAKKGWVWAIRETPEGEPWRIEMYWKAKEELDVLWPFEVDIYSVTWNTAALLFVFSEDGSMEPKARFPDEIQPELMAHCKPESHQPVLADQAFSATSAGYCLLKYKAGSDVWFEAVHSVSHTTVSAYSNIVTRAIGTELRPLDESGNSMESTHGEWPGYVYTPAGTAYNLGKYQYPSSYVDSATSYVFPVNIGMLEVWWSRRSPQEGLPKPIYFPGHVNRYQCEWPAKPKEITIASGLGTGGHTEDSDKWCVRFDLGALSLEEAQMQECHLKLAHPNGLNLNDSLTLELWVKPGTLEGMQYLIDKGGNFSLRLNGGVPELYAAGRWYSGSASLTTNWQHLAVSAANNGMISFYISGQEAGGAHLDGYLRPNTTPLRIGARASDGMTPEDFFSGRMDNVRIWSVQRSRDQVREDMNLVVAPDAPGLRARYRFDNEDMVYDTSLFGNNISLPPAGVYFDQPGIPQAQLGTDYSGVDIGIYVQNDRDLDGFNPNEEHAIIFGTTVYALRCDLNVTNGPSYTSEPYVLVDCQSPLVNSNRPYMDVYRVVASNSLYGFSRFLTAGLMIQPPYPISLMAPPNCSSNKQVAGPEFRDRKGYYWAKQAGDTGGTTNYVFDFYYPMQYDFIFPELSVQPDPGTQIGWLTGLSDDQTPIDFTYIVEWPLDVLSLNVGDTLTVAKNGLPAIRGQLSVEVTYQQSLALNADKPSVTLIDPTVARKAPLSDSDLVTAGMKSYRDVRSGCWFFSELPPDLRSRLYYNPNAGTDEALQITGEYRTRTDNENYLLLNLLAGSSRAATTNEGLVSGITGSSGDPWRAGIAALPETVVEIATNTTPFDSVALPTTGIGTGYVTVVFNNSTNRDMVDPSENIDMVIFRVSPELYRGQLDVIQSDNPLDKQLSVYYTADFRGTPWRWEFKWEYAEPVNGMAPDANSDRWMTYALGAGLNHQTIGDAGVFGLSDHYLRCTYRPLDADVIAVAGTNWAAWTAPVLCEGWIKRVLKAINPFEQRIRNFMNYEVLTDLSMLQQIGPPYAGDIPLNYEALNDYGLTQIYETLNSQADKLSVDAGFEASGSLALALLMVKGRLSDLYMVLGHEAYGDALDPTINLGAGDPVSSGESTSLFCFQNQEAGLLGEELALLRGRDDSVNPPVTQYPLYNRLAWNLTADITGGQVAYMLNYGISDLKGNQDGVLDAEDAQVLYPQGHGDAYGHYLSALKGYYQYLHNTNFTWYPQVEGILVGDSEVTVSYLHEKKMAVAAAARARSGLGVLKATHREAYDGSVEGWRCALDSNTNRAWGVGEWSCRVGMGAYFDWLAVNSLLPAEADDPSREGIQLINRQSVPELQELVDLARQVERQTDFADAGLNPLGLAPDAVPFDISSAGIDEGKTHFEQIYDRALHAVRDSLAVSERVRRCAQAIRDQNEASDLDTTVQADEARITRQLIELYGYPYADDIGPGKTYPQGYTGPDLLHYLYVDTWPLTPEMDVSTQEKTLVLTNYMYAVTTNKVALSARQLNWVSAVAAWFTGGAFGTDRGSNDYDVVTATYQTDTVSTVTINVANNGIPMKPSGYTGKRRAEGEIQIALSEYLSAVADLYSTLGEARNASVETKRAGESWLATQGYLVTKRQATIDATAKVRGYETIIQLIDTALTVAKMLDDNTRTMQETVITFLPQVVGLANDALAPARGAAKTVSTGQHVATIIGEIIARGSMVGLQVAITSVKDTLERDLLGLEIQNEGYQAGLEILNLLDKQLNLIHSVEGQLQRVETARMRLMSAISKGDQLQIERERLRMNWAADLNVRRYRNMAYRMFENDELVRYQQSFEVAARYVYLAAKAYDYETGLLESDNGNTAGSAFMKEIVKARALGRFSDWTQADNGEPLVGGATGDPGLADTMARMKANWDVLSGRLSFNNPQQETGRFSLRQELFRIPTNAASDANWRATLTACKVTNLKDLPEFARYCLPFDPMGNIEPAIVIPFSTTIDFRRNFFGHLLAGGDNAYDSTHFATKIRSVGVWFSGFDSGTAGLANQPRVYLVPAGADSMRVPLGDETRTRKWSVVDQALPVPYPITDAEWDQPDWNILQNVLGNDLYRIRKFPSMLAYHDSGDPDANLQVTWNSRLIGRSVWNSRWVLIIPGGTLLSDADEGIERFINGNLLPSGQRDGKGIKDIKLYFHTYSYSGN